MSDSSAGTPTPDRLDLDSTQLAIEERIGWLLTEVRTDRAELVRLRAQLAETRKEVSRLALHAEELRGQRQAALDLCDGEERYHGDPEEDQLVGQVIRRVRAALGATE